jgi:ketosteroid isomerase-like protein
MRYVYPSFFLFLLLAGCGSSANVESDSSGEVKEVKKAIKTFTDFYADKNPKVLKDLFTEEPEAILLGIGNEMWKGGENIRKKLEKQMDDVEDSNIDVRDQVVKVSGNTAWFSERGDWGYDYKGQRQNLEGVRLTGVLLKQDGKWKIAQWHTSYPVRAQ